MLKMKTIFVRSIFLYLVICFLVVYLFTVKHYGNTTVFVSCPCHTTGSDDKAKCRVELKSPYLTPFTATKSDTTTDIEHLSNRTSTGERLHPLDKHRSANTSHDIPISLKTMSKTTVYPKITHSIRASSLNKASITEKSNTSVGTINVKSNASVVTINVKSNTSVATNNVKSTTSASRKTHKFFQRWIPYIATNTLLHIGHESKKLNVSSLGRQDPVKYVKQLHGNRDCRSATSHILQSKHVIPQLYGNCSGPYATSVVSLVLHMDLNKDYWTKVKTICDKWDGPVSLALLFKDELPGDLSYLDVIKNSIKSFHIQAERLCVHIVRPLQSSNRYSVNTMRNVASQFAPTNRVLMLDVDFIPHKSLQQKLITHIGQAGGDRLKAFVIPAFAVKTNDVTFPQNKSQLLQQWTKKTIVPVHETKSFKYGHLTTDYQKWKTANTTYKVTYRTSYEPYYVVDRRYTPYYPEEFVFGIKDKSSHALLLDRLGFTFLVLPDVFIIHAMHGHQYSAPRSTRDIKCGYFVEKQLDKILLPPASPSSVVSHGNSSNLASVR